MARQGYIAGIVIRMGAEAAELGQAIDDATKSASKLQTELRRTEQALKLDPKNADLAKDKFDILTESVEETRRKLEALKQAQEKASDALAKGDISTAEYRALNREIAFTEAKLKDLEKAVDGVKWKEFADKAGNAETKLKDFGQRWEDRGAKLNRNITLPLLAIGAAAAKSAADMEALDAQFEQTFGDEANRAQRILEELGEEFGMLPNRMKPSLTAMTAFGKTAGMDTAEALDMSARAIRVASDSAAYYDRSLEDVTESLQSFLKGNYANDAALGIAATATTRNTKANELYGKSFNDLNEAQKQLTLLAMVEEGNMLSGAVGQAARESDQLVNQLGNMKQGAMEAAAQLGENFLPIVVDGMKIITDWTTKFKNLDEGTQDLILKLGLAAAAAGPVFTVVGKVGTGLGNVAGLVKKVSTRISEGGGLVKTLGSLKGAIGTVGGIGALAAVAGFAIYLGTVVANVRKGSEEIQSLEKSIADNKVEFEKSTTAISDNAKVSRNLADDIYNLATQENQSVGTKEALRSKIKELNDQYPDLNLAIDEETGKLNKSKEAVLDYISAREDMQLLDAYTEQSRQARLDAIELDREQAKALELLADAEKQGRIEWDERNQRYRQKGFLGIFGEAGTINSEVDYALATLERVSKALDGNASDQEFYAKTIEEISARVAEAQTEAADATEESAERQVTSTSAQQRAIRNAYRDHRRDLEESNELLRLEEIKRVNQMREKARERREIARGIRDDAVQYQNDIADKARQHNETMFNIENERLRTSDLSADQARKNLRKQIEDYDDWRNNLRILAGRVSPEMLAELEKLGPGYGKLVEDLLRYSATELRDFENLHLQTGRRSREAVITEMNKTTAAVQAAAHNSANAMRNEQNYMRQSGYMLGKAGKDGVKSGTSGIDKIGKDMANGLAGGITSRKAYVASVAGSVAKSAVDRMKSVAQIASPSKVTTEIGVNLGEGLEVGMDRSRLGVEYAASELSRSALAGFRGLEWMQNPAEFNVPEAALSNRQVYLQVGTLHVREDTDIDRIAAELDRRVRREERSLA